MKKYLWLFIGVIVGQMIGLFMAQEFAMAMSLIVVLIITFLFMTMDEKEHKEEK